jgi:hypothetical protein
MDEIGEEEYRGQPLILRTTHQGRVFKKDEDYTRDD